VLHGDARARQWCALAAVQAEVWSGRVCDLVRVTRYDALIGALALVRAETGGAGLREVAPSSSTRRRLPRSSVPHTRHSCPIRSP
jgi:hypothetical protein